MGIFSHGNWRVALPVLGALAALCVAPVQADPVADFYKGRTVTFSVGVGAGGSFALYARVFAPYLQKHLAGNPKIVVQYMPGASGRKLASFMHNAAPKDGTAIGMTLHTVPFSQKIRPKGVKYKSEQWNWIGNITPLNSVLAVSSSAPATTLAGAKKKEVVLGTSSKVSSGFFDPALVNLYLGTKFRMVFGYRGAGGMGKAFDGGETDGFVVNHLYWRTARAQMIRDGKVKFLVQFGHVKDKAMPNVPLFTDLLSDAQAIRVARFTSTPHTIARALFAPPGVPADRVRALRAAFDAAVSDPVFLADARKRRIPVNPSTGAEVQKVVNELVNAPPDIVAAVRKLMAKK
jgi:tripartite-type tricarboxylate transporter receptor subunit TctC